MSMIGIRLFILFIPTSSAQDVVIEQVATGLVSPAHVTHPQDKTFCLFILEHPKPINVLPPGATKPTLVRDILRQVLWRLPGMVFHPQFIVNDRFFVNYTRRPPDGAPVTAEYGVSERTPVVPYQRKRVFAPRDGR